MYEKLYSQASEVADKILSGSYQRRKPQNKSLISKPVNQPAETDEDEDVMLNYLVAVRRENLALKEMLSQRMPDFYKGTGEFNKRSPSKGSGKNYPISSEEIENIIFKEASLRGIDPKVAISIYRHEGRGNYQSQIARSGKGSDGGKEASYGPYQLYTGGGLGNKYEAATGRRLPSDNSVEGITNQIRFALDSAVDSGWGPWYGRKSAGISTRQGLEKAQKVGNWK